jgi:hypothetical protein
MFTAVIFSLALVQPPQNPADLLKQVRARMADYLDRLPDYTCQMTIERSVRRPGSDRFVDSDTLRFEVSYVGGQEMFAQPGADRFEEKALPDMVGGGAIGTGSFAMHARTIFTTDAARFTYAGAMVDNERPAYQFDFQVPRRRSGFVVRVHGRDGVIVGYRGHFLVDAETLDLIRLQVDVNDIPSRVPIAHTGETMIYARTRIGAGEFLLPRSSELFVRDSAGAESRNRLSFEGCRQYAGESVIRFEVERGPVEPPEEPEP